MADVLMVAGQALSVTGLLYGGYLSSLFRDVGAEEFSTGSKIVLLHHIAMA